MSKLYLLPLWIFYLFINEHNIFHQSALGVMLLLGVLYFFNKSKEPLISYEKLIIFTCCLYFVSFIPSFFIDPYFKLRHVDHPSRFVLFLPLMFYLREIKDFSLLKYVFTGSVIFSSLIVIISYIIFNVPRGLLSIVV